MAYQRWGQADRGERRIAYAVYLAALDRVGHAARAYADQIERLQRIST